MARVSGALIAGSSSESSPPKQSGRRHMEVTEVRTLNVLRLGLLPLALLLGGTTLAAAPVQVLLPEGSTRGFLRIRSPEGARLGHGELVQRMRGNDLESHLVLSFDDGSIYDEVTAYSQHGVFRLDAYRLTQRGPSFPGAEIAFDRKTGRYQAKVRGRIGAAEEQASGEFEMPTDLYNGMALTLLKNLPPGKGVTAQLAAFTPKPRLLRMELRREGEDRVVFGGNAKQATRLLVNLNVGGLTGVVASLMGKTPPDLRYWLVPGEVPAFVRFEGAMFLNGPVWRVEMAGVD
jgi:hypothetical protein